MITCVQAEASSAIRPMLLCLLGALLFAGCGKQQKPTSANSPSASASPAVSNAASSTSSPSVAGPGPGEKACFQCKGTGTISCRSCRAGKMDCPGPCLKLSKGNWEHKNVAGHSPSELWITFRGAKTFASWSQGHLGEVVVFQNGEPVNIGPCKICGGTTTVTCTVCKGQGKVTCEICSGKKFIPIAWTPTDNPWFNRQPDLIRLQDGQVILGRVAASTGDERTIVTRDKKILHVKASDILPKSEAVTPAATK